MDPHPSVCWTRGVEVEHALESAHAVASDNLAVGQMLSRRYRIEGELGEGGMGLVYLVRDEQVAGETFAVKVLKQGRDPEALSDLFSSRAGQELQDLECLERASRGADLGCHVPSVEEPGPNRKLIVR